MKAVILALSLFLSAGAWANQSNNDYDMVMCAYTVDYFLQDGCPGDMAGIDVFYLWNTVVPGKEHYLNPNPYAGDPKHYKWAYEAIQAARAGGGYIGAGAVKDYRLVFDHPTAQSSVGEAFRGSGDEFSVIILGNDLDIANKKTVEDAAIHEYAHALQRHIRGHDFVTDHYDEGVGGAYIEAFADVFTAITTGDWTVGPRDLSAPLYPFNTPGWWGLTHTDKGTSITAIFERISQKIGPGKTGLLLVEQMKYIKDSQGDAGLDEDDFRFWLEDAALNLPSLTVQDRYYISESWSELGIKSGSPILGAPLVPWGWTINKNSSGCGVFNGGNGRWWHLQTQSGVSNATSYEFQAATGIGGYYHENFIEINETADGYTDFHTQSATSKVRARAKNEFGASAFTYIDAASEGCN